MKRILLLTSFSLILGSCKSPTASVSYFVPSASAVYVLNQGYFGQGNSTLTAYYPDSNRTVNDVFKLANGRNLGDFGNDIAIYGNDAYMVINNSDKIEVMDATSGLSVGTVYFPSGTSPYRIAFDPLSDVAFVSDLYTNSVSVVNLSSNVLISQDTISVGKEPYGIAFVNGQVFVANSGYGSGNTVSVIDETTRKVVKTVTVGAGPTEVEADENGNVWVACPGQQGSVGSIYIISPSTDSVTDSINTGMQIPSFTGHTLTIDTRNGVAYLIADSSVVKLDVSTHKILDKSLISGSFYGISVDEATGNVYVTDAKGGKTNGVVYIYTSSGQYTNRSFTAGLYPDGIAFLR